MVTEIDKYVIKRVKEIRKKKRISQSQLAFELDLPTSFIAKAEGGREDKKYNVSHLNSIAKILECTIQDFFPEKPL